MSDTLYEVLGVEPSATSDEIDAAYKRLVRLTHPDAGGNDFLFRRVHEAHATLSNASKRSAYDASLREPSTGEPPQPDASGWVRVDDPPPGWSSTNGAGGGQHGSDWSEPTARPSAGPQNGAPYPPPSGSTPSRPASLGFLTTRPWLALLAAALICAYIVPTLAVFVFLLGGVAALGSRRAARRHALRFADTGAVDAMDGTRFEHYVGELFRREGYRVRLVGQTHDFGADLLLERGGRRTVVQTKRYSNSVGVDAVREAAPRVRTTAQTTPPWSLTRSSPGQPSNAPVRTESSCGTGRLSPTWRGARADSPPPRSRSSGASSLRACPSFSGSSARCSWPPLRPADAGGGARVDGEAVTLSYSPAPRQTGDVTKRSGGAPATRGPGRIDYVTADAVGFEHLPESLRRAVADLLVGAELAADAEPPVTKRRPDGGHYQQASGWWASTDRLVTIEGRRPLERLDDGRFTPVGDWVPSGEVMSFPPGLAPETSRWRFDGGSASGPGARRRKAADVLDALPPPLAAPVVGGESSAWQRYRRGWALETVVAIRRVDGRVRILRAEREATSLKALASADWVATTLDAPVVSTTAVEEIAKGSHQLSRRSTATPARPTGR